LRAVGGTNIADDGNKAGPVKSGPGILVLTSSNGN